MKDTIGSNKNIALYLQVKDVLIKRIQEKTWKPNTLIPTEQELMQEFDVSRTTLRQAISMLVQDGLLEKKQGRGTIVKPQPLIGGSLGKLKGLAEEVAEKGLTPNSKLIRTDFKKDLYYETSMLELDAGEEVLVIERIRFADEVPIAIERSCWPTHIGKILVEQDLNRAKFYEVLEENEIFLKRAKEKISAINATIYEADLLGIRGGEALLEMTRVSYGFDDKPLEFTVTKYRSDKYHYNIELTR
ncbi:MULTISPECIES: GntR family transcriptional regulator [Priestia]|uniref:GntR family transcriptional regulator n=2 Tax=Priestia TaxID=2800373 RepID=A0AAX6BMX9_PRIMG|nr:MULTISPECIES: GntR family transcriptional regulator [Priestia]MBK0294199.1 GntR family transcriptional regulator [Bacillus sp. S34]NHH95904.1 HTH-type transcriptional repressor YvoA [Bacillus sp. MB95]UPK51556.1 GntR family transcriptional regulator [Bacillus sp. H8-1]MBY0210155.1 GntR family transcriptional regulator [Priestia aryabhattai]MDC7765479.1 GntR family transcriptional regulator [Priestia aryabhattai]